MKLMNKCYFVGDFITNKMKVLRRSKDLFVSYKYVSNRKVTC